jgi:hypothetical protein
MLNSVHKLDMTLLAVTSPFDSNASDYADADP